MPQAGRASALRGSLAGVLSAAVALGVGEVGAALVRPAAAPAIAVGNRLILLAPEPAKRAAITRVGTADKALLFTGVYVLLAVFGAAVGALAMRRLAVGLGGVALFGAFGVYCALTAQAGRPADVLPTLAGTAAAMLTLTVLTRLARRSTHHPDGADGAIALPGRRWFVQAALATAGLVAFGDFAGRAAQRARFTVAAKRAAIRLPPADSPATDAPGRSPAPTADTAPAADLVLPTGPDLRVSGVPWATPNSSFYRIDTALTVPQVDPDTWTLRIHGMVDREITLTWPQLLARPMIDRWITLCCVSNTVGGNLVGNGLFRGTRLADLLHEAGVRPEADQLLLTSVDGYTFGAPTAVVLDGRDALLAIGMNGVPLPLEHGFPVRSIVPGLYGYVSACKWLIDIEATTFARDQAYWVQGGWARSPAIRLASRIDTPRAGGSVHVGQPTAIAGVAWDQHVGVSGVQVQIGDQPWQRARLATTPSIDTWRQWIYPWTPERVGSARLRVRAIDARGRPQDARLRAPFPSGATGLHTITVHATA